MTRSPKYDKVYISRDGFCRTSRFANGTPASKLVGTQGKKEVIAVLNRRFYIEHVLTGLPTGKVGLRPFTCNTAGFDATLISADLPPAQQGVDSPVAATSYISEVFSEVET